MLGRLALLVVSLLPLVPGAAVAAPTPTRATVAIHDRAGGPIAGAGTVRAFEKSHNALLDLTVTGLDPTMTYPWHVHLGSCEDLGAVAPFGDPGLGRSLRPNARGVAHLRLMLPLGSDVAVGGGYVLNIHMPPMPGMGGHGESVACGPIVPVP